MIVIITILVLHWALRSSGADAGFRVRGGASGVSRISAKGELKVRPHTKRGGGGASRLQVRYTKSGGGGGGAIPLQMIPLFGTYLRGILHTRARMNLKYIPAKVNLL